MKRERMEGKDNRREDKETDRVEIWARRRKETARRGREIQSNERI